MYYVTGKRAILNAAVAAIFAALLCAGCYDLGLEPSIPPPKEGTFVDRRDGNVYKKVQIGRQIWMAENLKYEADGSVCYDEGHEGEAWTRDPKSMCERYGRLYDWNTAMNGENSSNKNPSGIEGICPVGWHLPSDAEWSELMDTVGINSSTKLRAEEFGGWMGDPDGRDNYGFDALPGGIGSELSANFFPNRGSAPPYFWDGGRTGYWWSSTELDSDHTKAWWRMMAGDEEVYHLVYDKHYMVSVRCVHDY